MNFKKFLPIFAVLMLMILSMGAVSAADVSNQQVGVASGQVKKYVETEASLPSAVTVGSENVTSPQFLYLLTKSTTNVNSGISSSIAIKNLAVPSKPSESVKSGTLTKSQYITVANSINQFINTNGRLPNFANTNLGTMRYETLTYTYSSIMNFYNTNKRLPNYVSVKPWSTISKPTPPTPGTGVSPTQIAKSASSVKSFMESNDHLPSTVTVGSQTVTSPQFLYLLTKGTVNLNSGSSSNIAIKNVANPTKPSESAKSGTLTKSDYVKIANSIAIYITKNNRAPNYASSKLGNIRYDSLVYTFSNIMSFYNTKNRLPNYVESKPWSSESYGPPAKLNGTVKYTSTLLGENSYGYVVKASSYGSGTNKVAIITGVHPLEVQAHIAMLNAIDALHSSMKNVKIDVFAVVVYDGSDYALGRSRGQDLANKYVVPNIGSSYKLVIDTHSHRGLGSYTSANFMFAPYADTKSKSYANQIIGLTNGNLEYLNIEDGTSPQYVTIPIAKKGIPTLIYEQYLNQPNYAKVLYNNALQVVKSVNTIFA